MSPLKIPMTKPSSVAEGVSMWEWSGSAFDEGEEAAKWFSDYLGKQSRLVRFNKGFDFCSCDIFICKLQQILMHRADQVFFNFVQRLKLDPRLLSLQQVTLQHLQICFRFWLHLR